MSQKTRIEYIDQFRGVVGILMLLGHSSYYFNSVWRSLEPEDPLFGSFGQFVLRYLGYLCAPGFLMMNGAMVWHSYTRRRAAGEADWKARWHLIQRGLFLVIVQMTWVNSSWSGFQEFKPGHIGIIACIGISMIMLTLMVGAGWRARLAVMLIVFAGYPLLLRIPYDRESGWQTVLMQTFIAEGEFNKYPVIPWFGLAVAGSVMATGWITYWKTFRQRVLMSFGIAVVALGLAALVRLGRGYGNLLPFSDPWHYSFLLDQKYPPSLYHLLWFFGSVVAGVGVIQVIGRVLPGLLTPLGWVGKVPLFFYAVHIGILGVFSKRIGIYYREGEIAETLFGWALMLAVMLPLAVWFGAVKRRSRNYLVQLI